VDRRERACRTTFQVVKRISSDWGFTQMLVHSEKHGHWEY
jgi:hypothetical protein